MKRKAGHATPRAVVCLSLLLMAGSAAAQSPVSATTSTQGGAPARLREVRGTVILGSTGRDRGLGDQLVVLHRIAPTGSGPVDSVRTKRDGAFRLSFRADSGALYLFSVRYAGIGYFSTPLAGNDDAAADAPAEIVVYDTSSTARNAALRGRHVIVSAPDPSGQRAMVEVFELANDSSVTLISATESSPVWRLHLPTAAIKPRVGEGEFAPQAVRFDSGEVKLFAPLPPGLKQLVVSYELPATAFPLSMPMERPSTVLEVLLEEQGGRAEGARLTAQEAVTVGGRRFQRALAQDVDSSAVLAITLPLVTTTTGGGVAWIAIPVIALLALGGWLVVRRRQPAPALAAAGAPSPSVRSAVSATALAHRVATLDALLAQDGAIDAATRAGYSAERTAVLEQLKDAIHAERQD